MVTLYYILENEQGRYYDFVDDSFVYSFDFECMTSKKEFANECAESLKRCGWDVEVCSHTFD